jgi:hypothetical protein
MGVQRRAGVGGAAVLAAVLGGLGALAGLAGQARGQATYVFSDLPCATFVDLPPAAGPAVPMLPLVTALCNASGLTVTSRSYPLRPPPDTDNAFITGTFTYSPTSTLNDPIDPAINPGDRRGAFQGSNGASGDLLLDFSVPLSSVGMSTFQVNGAPLTSPDRIRVFDGPLGTGNLLANIQSQPGPAGQFRRAVRFTGFNAGSAVIRSIVIDVASDVDGLFLDGLAFGLEAPACGTADFDGDGDIGTDADIEAFFACLAGNCCATCFAGGADFNGDGDIGTDADIEAFFSVLAGGNC